MERLFEAFLGAKLRQAWQGAPDCRFQIILQGPQKSLAQSDAGPAFRLRPDITVLDDGRAVRIFDAKWKRLNPKARSSGLAPSDVYQLVTYASRYGCERVVLVYPASVDCPAGLVENYRLDIPGAPMLEAHAVDVRALGRSGPLPLELCPPLQRIEQAAKGGPKSLANVAWPVV
jgi:5-methylcytosine-specific restriction enzyme subunit McrC